MVKKWLDSKAFSYDVVNLDEQPDKRQEAFDISGGASTVPITVVTKHDDTKDVIVGWNLAKLAPAVAS
jgi:glutaredoxin